MKPRSYTVVTAARSKRARFTNKREAIRFAHRLARRVLRQRVSVYDRDQLLVHQVHARYVRGSGATVRIVVEEL